MSIFKPCDIRGVYPDELDETTAELTGRAIGTELEGGDCVLAGDVRTSTPALKSALLKGLTAAGAGVIDVGTTPTPVAYWAKSRLDADGAVIVTASHNPPEYNGVKFIIGELPVTPEDVERVRQRVEEGDFRSGSGHAVHRPVKEDYLRWLGERYRETGVGLKVVVDAGNGALSTWAPEAFRAAGYEVEELFCTPDGTFPNRSANPSNPSALEAAAARTREADADFAACFDGDGDRVVFLDETGEFVPPEETLILLVRHALGKADGRRDAVVYDQKCTRLVPEEIREAGGRPVMERSGHAFIKRRLLQEDALLAGEASGHFFFRELGGDDGLYAALLMGRLLGERGQSLGALRASISPYFISEDIRIPRPGGEAERVVERLGDAFADRPQDRMDGVRIQFEGGWALVRPSVTEPAVTVRVEGDSPERMEQIKSRVLEEIRRAP